MAFLPHQLFKTQETEPQAIPRTLLWMHTVCIQIIHHPPGWCPDISDNSAIFRPQHVLSWFQSTSPTFVSTWHLC